MLECTLDGFLGGRIVAAQPKTGFRAGHDSVFLAAAVPSDPGAKVLELGSGAGIASICFGWRAGRSSVHGLEIDAELVEIANSNAARNGMAGRVHFCEKDVWEFRGEVFDHVFFNPPFHRAEGTQSPNPGRNAAKRDPGDAVRTWTELALTSVRPGGTVTAILSFDRVPDLLTRLKGNRALIFPLYPRPGSNPKRAIVQITAAQGEIALAAGLVLHREEGGNSAEAEAILRSASPLRLREARLLDR